MSNVLFLALLVMALSILLVIVIMIGAVISFYRDRHECPVIVPDLHAGVRAWYSIVGNANGVYSPEVANQLRMYGASLFYQACIKDGGLKDD